MKCQGAILSGWVMLVIFKGLILFPTFNSSDGIGYEIYLSGCSREPKCDGCHNPELWNYDFGSDLDLNYMSIPEYIDNVILMGGEPLDRDPRIIHEIVSWAKKSNKNVWLYTSYELDQVFLKLPKETVGLIDVIKTGRYIKELRCDDYVLASLNQMFWKRDQFGNWRPHLFRGQLTLQNKFVFGDSFLDK